jgi:hypothetical protein
VDEYEPMAREVPPFRACGLHKSLPAGARQPLSGSTVSMSSDLPQWNAFSEPYPAMRMKAWLGKSMTPGGDFAQFFSFCRSHASTVFVGSTASSSTCSWMIFLICPSRWRLPAQSAPNSGRCCNVAIYSLTGLGFRSYLNFPICRAIAQRVWDRLAGGSAVPVALRGEQLSPNVA